MSSAKLIVLAVISFVATGSVIYQLRNRRPAPAVTAPAEKPAASLHTRQAAAVSTPEPAVVPVVQNTNVPLNGWGRDPFLTREEINAANRRPESEIAQAPAVEAPPPAPPAPPSYVVSAIIYGPNGSFAIVNSRVVQTGDRVGMETVKEIKDRAVVLEHEGRTRELPLRRVGTEIQVVPRGD
jgi:hypothetical protein